MVDAEEKETWFLSSNFKFIFIGESGGSGTRQGVTCAMVQVLRAKGPESMQAGERDFFIEEKPLRLVSRGRGVELAQASVLESLHL